VELDGVATTGRYRAGVDLDDPVLLDLTAQQVELAELLAPLDDDGWRSPSPCPGWDVADVVLHLAQTNEMAIASARGTFDQTLEAMTRSLADASNVDDGAGLMVEAERGEPTAVVHARWRMSVDALHHALVDTDPSARLQWVAGELSCRTLATTRLAETWIHTTDVAEALGHDLAPTERLRPIARLAWRTLPYAFARSGQELSGPVAFHLTGPAGDAWNFDPDEDARTVVEGPAAELCAVAGQRREPADTSLSAKGPDATAVLALVRTFA
jgi:uncharacterized protein (TIGR03084 family)